jgi:hypothetical protein
LAQKKDDYCKSGTNLKSNLSFVNFSEQEILTRASKLGVSLGSNSVKISSSVSLIKNQEVDRGITYLKNNFKEVVSDEFQSLVLPRASTLSEDLLEEEEEGLAVSMVGNKTPGKRTTRVKSSRKKKSKDFGLSLRRSERIVKINKGLK